jgi:hypothetical protein
MMIGADIYRQYSPVEPPLETPLETPPSASRRALVGMLGIVHEELSEAAMASPTIRSRRHANPLPHSPGHLSLERAKAAMIAPRADLALMAATDWTRIGSLAESVTAGIAVLALFGVIAQLAQNRRHERARLAHRYLERYGHPDEIQLVAELVRFIKVDAAARGATLAHWEAMSLEAKLEILHGLNFWEELAGMYKRKLVDRKIVREYFGVPALTYWKWSEWFIDDQRKKGAGNGLMQQFEEMCDHIRGGRRAATEKRTFPYLRSWRGSGRAEQLAQSRQDIAAAYAWQQQLVNADPLERERMLDELRSGAGRT